ncbi:TIGR03364 family FAD-dependent oxidoreductase [Lysinimonas soli]|uniref:TIGR03364 family FAD-dependent oxidoreductase n=1 Tax=Lysinimonas soli TaxID=1074233 RepID=A0ABW0NK27_9MICO
MSTPAHPSIPADGPGDVVDGRVDTDVLVVGAGIVGLAHAIAAVERGLTVTIIDRDARAVGASIRNFGHACVTAQSHELLQLATVAREKWLRYADRAGFFVSRAGAIAIARSAAESAVLEELAGSRDAEQLRLLGAAQVREHLGSASDPTIRGGAWLRDDLRVDPREAVGALAAWLAEQPGVRFAWRTTFLGASGGVVRTSRGDIRAARTIVCVGHDLDLLYPQLAAEYEVERCALQMARVEPPAGLELGPAVLTGTSMIRYPAFAETDAATALRAELAAEHPELVSIVANVMFTQRPDGTLIVGDSHRYGVTQDPFLAEATSGILLEAVARILGVPGLRVLERWQGVYASSARQPFLIAEPEPGVTVAVVTSGVGMTIGLGLAEKTFGTFV